MWAAYGVFTWHKHVTEVRQPWRHRLGRAVECLQRVLEGGLVPGTNRPFDSMPVTVCFYNGKRRGLVAQTPALYDTVCRVASYAGYTPAATPHHTGQFACIDLFLHGRGCQPRWALEAAIPVVDELRQCHAWRSKQVIRMPLMSSVQHRQRAIGPSWSMSVNHTNPGIGPL